MANGKESCNMAELCAMRYARTDYNINKQHLQTMGTGVIA